MIRVTSHVAGEQKHSPFPAHEECNSSVRVRELYFCRSKCVRALQHEFKIIILSYLKYMFIEGNIFVYKSSLGTVQTNVNELFPKKASNFIQNEGIRWVHCLKLECKLVSEQQGKSVIVSTVEKFRNVSARLWCCCDLFSYPINQNDKVVTGGTPLASGMSS